MMFNVSLLTRNFTTAVILSRNIRVKNQIIIVVEVMKKLMSIRKQVTQWVQGLMRGIRIERVVRE